VTNLQRYSSRELRAVYYGGNGYIVRRDTYPRHRRQVVSVSVGVRQGLAAPSGFTVFTYRRPA
jgi:hypothetical protein